MPVPIVMHSTWRNRCPAPKRYSAHAVRLASLSMTTGTPSRSSRAALSGSRRQDRCGENSTVEREASTKPAAPTPTARTACLEASSCTASTIVASTTEGALLRSGVSRRSTSSTCPVRSTTPASSLVPPMSTPTVAEASGLPATAVVRVLRRVRARTKDS